MTSNWPKCLHTLIEVSSPALATMLVQAVSIIFLNLTVKGAARVLFVDIVSSLSRATFSFIQSVSSNELMER